MNAHRTEIETGHALAISIWENEGGTSAPELMDDQYGRRIEAHRPLAIYHVSAGAPAPVNGNLRNMERRIKRLSLSRRRAAALRGTEAR
jgi:hypothetical protein